MNFKIPLIVFSLFAFYAPNLNGQPRPLGFGQKQALMDRSNQAMAIRNLVYASYYSEVEINQANWLKEEGIPDSVILLVLKHRVKVNEEYLASLKVAVKRGFPMSFIERDLIQRRRYKVPAYPPAWYHTSWQPISSSGFRPRLSRFSFGFGIASPMADFGSSDIANPRSGFARQGLGASLFFTRTFQLRDIPRLAIGYHVGQRFSLLPLDRHATFEQTYHNAGLEGILRDSISLKGSVGSWTLFNFQIGPSASFMLGRNGRWFMDMGTSVGLATSLVPSVEMESAIIKEDTIRIREHKFLSGTSFGLQLSGNAGLRLYLAEYISIGIEAFYSTASFKNRMGFRSALRNPSAAKPLSDRIEQPTMEVYLKLNIELTRKGG